MPTNIIHPAVRARLLESGHYHESQGRIISNYFSILHRSLNDFHRNYAHAPLIAGNVESIKKGNHIAFRMKYGNTTEEYSGLEFNVRIEELNSPPIYIMDNHHFAYYAWHEARTMGYVENNARLIHIDQHPDNAPPDAPYRANSLEEHANYVKYILAIDSFIKPALESGLVDKYCNFEVHPAMGLDDTTVNELECTTNSYRLLGKQHHKEKCSKLSDLINPGNILSVNPKKTILDIDLDAFVKDSYDADKLPTSDDFAYAAEFLADIALRAGVVTIATSPSFADQDTAVIAAKRIVQEIINRT